MHRGASFKDASRPRQGPRPSPRFSAPGNPNGGAYAFALAYRATRTLRRSYSALVGTPYYASASPTGAALAKETFEAAPGRVDTGHISKEYL